MQISSMVSELYLCFVLFIFLLEIHIFYFIERTGIISVGLLELMIYMKNKGFVVNLESNLGFLLPIEIGAMRSSLEEMNLSYCTFRGESMD